MASKSVLGMLIAALLIASAAGQMALAASEPSARVVLYDDGSGSLVVNLSLPSGINVSGYYFVVIRENYIAVNYSLAGTVPTTIPGAGQPMVIDYRARAQGTRDKLEAEFQVEWNTSSGQLWVRWSATANLEPTGETRGVVELEIEGSGSIAQFIDNLYQAVQQYQGLAPNGTTVTIEQYEPGRMLKVRVEGNLSEPMPDNLPLNLPPAFNNTWYRHGLILKELTARGHYEAHTGRFSARGMAVLEGNVSSLISSESPGTLSEEIVGSISAESLSPVYPSAFQSLEATILDSLDYLESQDIRVETPTVMGYIIQNKSLTIVYPRVRPASGDAQTLLLRLAKDKLGAEKVTTTQAENDEPPISLPGPVKEAYEGQLTSRNMDAIALLGITLLTLTVAAALVILARKL